jgi:hypothetical protein
MEKGEACIGFWWRNLRVRDNWGDPGVDGSLRKAMPLCVINTITLEPSNTNNVSIIIMLKCFTRATCFNPN